MKKYSLKLYWICIDLLSLNFAIILSIILRFGGDWRENLYQYRAIFLYLSILYLVFAYIFKLYIRIWRYISINDLFLIAGTVTSTVVFCILYFNILLGIYFPWTIKVLIWFISLALIAGNKLVWRLYWERNNRFKRKEDRILVVGAGDAGDIVCREIEKRKDLGQMIGFIDDDMMKIGSTIRNKKVLGTVDDINKIISRKKIGMVIIAIPSAHGAEIRRIVRKINSKDVKIKTVPGVYELINEKVEVSRIRNVEVKDLLNRDSINLDVEKISEYIKRKRIMVTGGAGSIGEEISIQVCKFSPEKLMILDHNENGLFYTEKKIRKEYGDLKLEIIMADIKDRKKLEAVFKKFKPEVIFHAAAHKHVPMMEYHPDEAVKNNIIGTKNLVELADEWEVKNFVMISTDKAIHPTSVMGASKQVAEMIIKMYAKKSKTHFAAVRFGNVLESNGSVIPTFKKQIKDGGPVTITDKEIKRYFMTISEASQLVIQAGGLGIREAVFVLDMGEPVKILDLACNLIQLSGLIPNEDVKIEFIGLRPGEKLFEELLTEKEKSRVSGESGHEKIFIAETEGIHEKKLEKDIKELEVLAKEMDHDGIVKKLQEIIPGYKPNRKMMKKK